jgi:hypothetical protein
MPGYIKKKLQEYQHTLARRVQNCPYSPDPKQFGVDAQALIEQDATAALDAKGIKRVQQIVGSILGKSVQKHSSYSCRPQWTLPVGGAFQKPYQISPIKMNSVNLTK